LSWLGYCGIFPGALAWWEMAGKPEFFSFPSFFWWNWFWWCPFFPYHDVHFFFNGVPEDYTDTPPFFLAGQFYGGRTKCCFVPVFGLVWSGWQPCFGFGSSFHSMYGHMDHIQGAWYFGVFFYENSLAIFFISMVVLVVAETVLFLLGWDQDGMGPTYSGRM
jgi:hypothetical protein